MATSKFSQVDEYGFVRPNDFDYGTYEVFMSKYLKVLAVRAKKWTKLIQEGKSISRSRILKRYIRKGIPNEYRGQIWSHVSGVEDIKLQFGHDLFQRLLEGPHNQEIVDSINTDIPRTFPDNIFFSNVHEERPLQLYRILLAYAHHNRKVGYCQDCYY
uniref:Rab-GAP TBC domain-containing protein n=1 Tax=Clastoptera arizonana TaxID=38151 RepID=A0A1B6DKQ1_9HEMI